jgi:ParB-like chromosome segregation protein Spo0J
MAVRKKKIGRPRVEIDLELVEKLAHIQCTIREIAAILDIPPSTLAGREDFRTAYEKGMENGKASLRRIQFRLAEKNAAMAIWLGKQYLGQRDIKEEVKEDDKPDAKALITALDTTTPTSYSIKDMAS